MENKNIKNKPQKCGRWLFLHSRFSKIFRGKTPLIKEIHRLNPQNLSSTTTAAEGKEKEPEISPQLTQSTRNLSLGHTEIETSIPKGNDRSPESNVPRSNLISKKYKWAMETRGPKLKSSELLCLSWLPATLMMIRSKMNELAWRQHFPITSLWEIV